MNRAGADPPERSQAGPGAKGRCPDAEELASFIDARLDTGRRAAVADHVSGCEDCYEVVRESMAINKLADKGAASRAHRVGARQLLAAAAAVVIAVAGIAIWRASRPTDAYAQAVRPLVDAVGSRRFYEGRLTGGFAYGPLVAPLRGAGSPEAGQNWEVLAAASRIRSAAETDRTPERLRALAVAHHVLGEDDDAIRILEEISQSTPEATVFSDLAAAFLSGTDASHALDTAKALEAATKATELDPALPEAHYNRALALERLGLRQQAIASWEEYLRLEPTGGWAEEARKRLEALRARPGPGASRLEGDLRAAIDSGNVTVMREFIDSNLSWSWDQWEDAHLAEWADAMTGGEQGLQVRLALFARTLADQTGDASLAPSPDAAGADAAKAYVRGRRLYEAAQWTEASNAFETMPPALRGTGLWWWARLYQGVLAHQQARPSDAERLLDEVIRTAEGRGWRMLAGRAHWSRAVVAGTQGQLDAALREYAAAGREFAALGAKGHERFISHLESEVLDLIGHSRAAWSARRIALLSLPSFRRPRHRFGVYLIAVASAVEAEMPRVAEALLQEAELDVQATGAPADRLQLVLRKAALSRVLRTTAARPLFAVARRELSAIEDPAARARFGQEVLITEALSRPSDARSLDALDRAIASLIERHATARLPELLFERAARRGAAGDWVGLERDVDEALAVYASARGLDSASRQAYWRQGEIRVPRLVDAALGSARTPIAGLLEVERTRALWYHERAIALGELRDVLSSVVAGLGPAEIGLVYFDGEETRGVAVLRRGGYDVVRLPGLPGDVRRLRNAAAVASRHRDERRLLDAQGALRALLIDPVATHLMESRRLLVVPSADTLGVSFPSLWNPTTRRFLVEDFRVESFPSVWALQPATASHGDGGRVVFFAGSPAVAEAPLRGIAVEREQLRGIYGDRFVEARPPTKAALLETMRDAAVVHFSGHVRSGRKYPGLSWLTTDIGGVPHLLFAHDLQSARLRRGTLVVINGCRSAGDVEARDGGVGFVRPFMLSGAEVVVASAWDVADDKAAEVMGALHRILAAGEVPPDAVTAVQREMIRRREPAWGWGGYGVFRARRDGVAHAPTT